MYVSLNQLGKVEEKCNKLYNNWYFYFSSYPLMCFNQLVKLKHTKLLCLTVPQWLLRVYVVCILASQKSGGMKIIPFDVVCLDINLRPDIKQKMMSLHSAPMHPSNQTYILLIYRCFIIKDWELRLLHSTIAAYLSLIIFLFLGKTISTSQLQWIVQ